MHLLKNNKKPFVHPPSYPPADAAAAVPSYSSPPLQFELAAARPLAACFASLGSSLLGGPGSDGPRFRQVPLFDLARAAPSKEPTSFKVIRITGDGRCLFRALAKGMALNQARPIALLLLPVGRRLLHSWLPLLPAANATSGRLALL